MYCGKYKKKTHLGSTKKIFNNKKNPILCRFDGIRQSFSAVCIKITWLNFNGYQWIEWYISKKKGKMSGPKKVFHKRESIKIENISI